MACGCVVPSASFNSSSTSFSFVHRQTNKQRGREGRECALVWGPSYDTLQPAVTEQHDSAWAHVPASATDISFPVKLALARTWASLTMRWSSANPTSRGPSGDFIIVRYNTLIKQREREQHNTETERRCQRLLSLPWNQAHCLRTTRVQTYLR